MGGGGRAEGGAKQCSGWGGMTLARNRVWSPGVLHMALTLIVSGRLAQGTFKHFMHAHVQTCICAHTPR